MGATMTFLPNMASNEVHILNAGGNSHEDLLSAVDLSKELQKLMLKIKGRFISEDGHTVDYNALKESDLFKEYVKMTAALTQVNLTSLERTEKIAFFLNIYNSLTIHGLAVCENGIPDSVLEISRFWRRTAYNIGGYIFSLDDIEHGILRGNRPHPSDGRSLFAEGDPRDQFVVSNVDPRIHFALVCGAKSCPAIQVFTAKNLESGLAAAARSFCSQEVITDNNEVILSRIFLWYKTDFGSSDEERLRWIMQHLDKDEQEKLNILLGAPNIKVSYKEYDWNLNGSKL
ncbi:PREDICTED: uncharacterized protein LOC107346125 isoform X2 [Acropora digitifera]|uniref:uncharacterized protein LOC107346125 isoform X2 n=1 Tax=Acropora digitifera TaxID=70779 RepID=UPI00077A6DE0|nr:PREDICTED: uncharacterized protein LOC107346125 isoform X2 [Acropora digitifera]